MKLPKERIEEVAPAPDCDWSYRYFPGLCYEPEKGRLYACDGTVMVIVPSEPEPNETAGFIPVEAIRRMRKHHGTLRALKALVLRSEDGSTITTMRRAAQPMRDIDAVAKKFRYAGTPDFSFDANLLISMTKAMRPNSRTPRRLNFFIDHTKGPTDYAPLLVSADGTDSPVALIMPCTVDSKATAEEALARVSLPSKQSADTAKPEPEAAKC